MPRVLWVSALLALPLTKAFTFSRTRPLPRAAFASVAEDETSSPTVPSPPPSVTSSKDDLLASVASGSGMVTSSKRVMVSELLLSLEAGNPTTAPATSPLVNGEWDLVYSGGYADGLVKSPTRQIALFMYAGGYAPTSFGLNLARLLPDELLEITRTKLTIQRSQPRVTAEAEVKAFGNKVQPITILSTLERESDVRLKETYTTLKVGDRSVEVPEAVQYSRLLFITYLDEDLMVVRDATGVAEVLLRKEKEFQGTSGSPSSADDDLAPGAG